MASEKFYPSEHDLGRDCLFWRGISTDPVMHIGTRAVGCYFPKAEMEGRLSCEGVIDDVCLFLKDGRQPKSLTPDQISEIRHRSSFGDNRDLPPGDIK